MKKILLCAFFVIAMVFAISAQEVTRVGVIDLQKIYSTYYSGSESVRAFEEEKKAVQGEINRLSSELKQLQKDRLLVLNSGDTKALKTFDANLYMKAQYLSDFIKVKQAELDEKAENMTKNDEFAKQLYKAVQRISEKDGFSLIISSKDASDVGSSIIWFSPMIDITDKVVQALLVQ